MSKSKLRRRMAALSFSEKLRILEKLRDRSQKIAAGGLRKPSPQSDSKRDAIRK